MTNQANASGASNSSVEPKENIVTSEVFERFKEDLFKQKNANNELKKSIEDYQSKLAEFERKEQEKAGNFDQVKKGLEEQVAKLKDANKSIKETFIDKTLFKTIKMEAKNKGCKDPEVFLKLLSKDQLKEVMTEDFDFDDKKINELIEGVAKEKSYLFEGSAPKVKDAVPKANHKESEVDFKTAISRAKSQKEIEEIVARFNKN